MANQPYEVGKGGYGSYHKRSRSGQPAQAEAAATTTVGVPVGAQAQTGYLVGGEAPLDAAPVTEDYRDPTESRRRKILWIALAVATAVAILVFVVGQFVFKTAEPAPNPSEPLPTLPQGVPGPTNP